MPQQPSSPRLVQFGVFELDLQQAELRKQGVKISPSKSCNYSLRLPERSLAAINSARASGLPTPSWNLTKDSTAPWLDCGTLWVITPQARASLKPWPATATALSQMSPRCLRH